MSNFWEKDEPVKAAPTPGNPQNFWEKDTPVAPAPDQSVPHAISSGIASQFLSSIPFIGPIVQPVAPALTSDYANLMANSWHRETANSALANLAENLNEQQQIKSDPNYASKGPGLYNPGAASQPPGAVGGGAYSGLGGINWTTPVVTPSPSERLASLKQGQVSLQQDFTQATNNIKANTSNNLTAFNAFNEAKTGGDMAKAFLSNPGQVFGGTMASGAWPLARGTGMVLGTGAAVAATGGGAIPVALAGGAVGGLDAGIHAYPRKIAEVLQSAGRKSGIDIEAHPELLSKVMSDPKIYAEAAAEAKAAGINDAIWMGVLSAAGLGAGKIASVPLRVATNMGVQTAGGAGMSITEQLATKGKVDDWSAVRHGGVGGLMNAIPFEAYHAVTAKKGPPPLPKFTPEAKPGEPAPVQSTLGVDAQGNPIEVQPEAAPAPTPAAAEATPAPASVPDPAALPEGHVPPMPEGKAEADAWVAKYGKTHEVDGTPLSPDAAARAAGSTSIADVVAPEEAAPQVDTAQVLAQKKAQLDAINRQLDQAGRRITDETTLAHLDAEHERISAEYEDALAAHENAQNAAKPKSIADVVAPKEANTDTMSRKEEIRFIEAEINRRQIEVDNAKKNGRSAPEAEAAIERLKVRLEKAQEGQQTPTMGNPALPRSVQMLDAEAAASAARAAAAKPAAPAPKPAAVATPAQEAKPTAPAPVAEAAPAGEPAPVKRTKSIDQAIEQIAKLEARLANATPKEANQIRNQLNLRKKQVNAYEKDNGRPKMYDLKAKPVAAEPTPVAEPVAPVEPAKASPVAEATTVEPAKATPVAEAETPAETQAEPKEETKTPVAETPVEETPKPKTEPTAPDAEKTKTIIKGLEDQIAKSEKAGRGDSEQTKKQRATLEAAKAKLAEMEGTQKEAETPAETQAEPGEEPKVASTPEREAKIKAILDNADASHVSHTFNVREVIEHKGSDGKWYTNGWPSNVKLTGEKRVGGWGITDKNGIGIGKRYATEAEAKASLENNRAGNREQFKKALEASSDERLNDQAKTWEEQKAAFERNNPEIAKQRETAARQSKPVEPAKNTEQPKTSEKVNFREKKASGEDPMVEGRKRLAAIEGEGVLRRSADGNVELITPEWRVTHDPETGTWTSRGIGRETYENLSKRHSVDKTEASKNIDAENAKNAADALDAENEAKQKRLREEAQGRADNQAWREKLNNEVKGKKGTFEAVKIRDGKSTKETVNATIYGDGWAVSGSGNDYGVFHTKTGLRLRGNMSREQATTLAKGLVHGEIDPNFTDPNSVGTEVKNKIKDIMQSAVSGNHPPEYLSMPKEQAAPEAPAVAPEPTTPAEPAKSTEAPTDAESQVNGINDKLAELERQKKGESPEAEALRKQRDELQAKIDAGKPASPDARSDSEKWADDVLKRFDKGQANTSLLGVDPEVVAALAVKGYHIAARTVKGVAIDFNEWSKEMVKEFGDGVKPHLEAAWNKVRDPNLAREVAEHQQARIDAGKPSLDLHAELARSAATLDADRQIALAAAADKNKPSTMTNLYQAAIGNPLAAWFRSNGSRMRSLVELNPGSAEIKKVVEQFIGTPGKNGERYFTHVVANQTGAFLNKFVMATNKLLFHPDYQKMTPEQRQALNTQLINAIESGKEFQGAFGEAVKGIKDLLAETHKYGTEAGLEMGHAANYFPRGMDGEAIRSNPEAFVQAAAKAYEAKWNREQAGARAGELNLDVGGQEKKPDFVEMARKWKDAILFSHEGRDFEENILGEKKPANKENFQKEREFTKEEAKLFEEFRNKDVASLVARHIGDMVRKAEIAKRLGSEGEKWIASKKQMAADKVSDAHVENLRKLIRNQMGLDQPGEYVPTRDVEGTPTTIGEKVVNAAERFRRYVESSDNTLMKAVQLHTALVYLTKTPALMAAEPAAIAMRKGEALGGARMIAQNLVRFSNVLKRAEPGSLKAINTEIERVYGKGHDLASAISLELGITRLSNDFMSQGSGFLPEDISRSSLHGLDKLSEGVQKMYLLHQMETAKRETGVREGMNYLDKLVDHANGENMMVNILKKHLGRETDGGMFDTRQFGANNLEGLGIPKEEHAQFSDFVKKLRGMSESERLSAIMDRNDPMAARYRKGVELFSKQATVQSTSASKTEVANSSNVGKVIFNLLTYPQEFALQHKAFLHEQSKLLMSGKDSGVSPAEKLKAASTMFALAPAAAAMYGVTKLYRAYDNLEFNSDDEHEQKHVMGLPAPVSEAITSVSRTGVGGAPTEMAWRSLERGEPPAPIVTSLGGEIFKSVSGNSDAKRTGKVLFKDVAAPFGNAAMIKAADMAPGAWKLPAKGAAFIGTHVMAHKKASDAAGEAAAGE